MFRSSNNLIVVTSHAVASATISGAKVSDLVEQARPADADLVTAVELGLDLAGANVRKVWLILSDLWSQPIHIQSEVARRIPPDQLAQFACFEVEPFSGISPSQGVAGVVELPKTGPDPSYWVTEIDRNTLDQIESMIRSRGGKIAGVLHPAGAPQAIRPEGALAWNRLELWHDSLVCLAGRGAKDFRKQVFPRGGSDSALQSALSWFAEQGPAAHQEVWNATAEFFEAPSTQAASAQAADAEISPQAAPQASPAWVEFSPEKPDDLRAWLEAWGRSFAARPALPVILPPKRPMTARDKQFVTALLAAGAILAAVVHYQGMGYWNRSADRALDEPISILTGPTNAAKALRKSIGEHQKELAALTTKEADLKAELVRFRTVADAQKRRIPELLEALSEACGPGVLVHKIESDAGRMKVYGRCLDTRHANQVVQVLARRLSSLGLAISPPDKEATYRLMDGGPHEFQFFIDDATPMAGQ